MFKISENSFIRDSGDFDSIILPMFGRVEITTTYEIIQSDKKQRKVSNLSFVSVFGETVDQTKFTNIKISDGIGYQVYVPDTLLAPSDLIFNNFDAEAKSIIEGSPSGCIVMTVNKFAEIFDRNFYRFLRGLQSSNVLWKKTDVVVYSDSVCTAFGCFKEGDSQKSLSVYSFLAGNKALGNIEKVGSFDRSFSLNCYLKDAFKGENFKKPIRFSISGVPFEKRAEYLDDQNLVSLRNVFTGGFEVMTGIFFTPVFNAGGFLRPCKATSVENFTVFKNSKEIEI